MNTSDTGEHPADALVGFNPLTPDTEKKPTHKEIKEEIKKTNYFKSLDEDGNPPDTELEDNITSALSSNPALRDKILALVSSRDTYWNKHEQDMYESLDKEYQLQVEHAKEERDTYWKERVEGMKRKLELEYVEGECVECAGTGEGSDNPNSNSSETYPCYLCRGKGRFSGYTKKTVDTLLDNLK